MCVENMKISSFFVHSSDIDNYSYQKVYLQEKV